MTSFHLLPKNQVRSTDHRESHCIPAMASTQLGLKIAFYTYPCLLFLTLFGVQSYQFYRSRRRNARHDASNVEPPQNAGSVRIIYARLIWSFQLVLSALLIVSIVIAVREAVARQHEVVGTIEFSFSAYLVCPFRFQHYTYPIYLQHI